MLFIQQRTRMRVKRPSLSATSRYPFDVLHLAGEDKETKVSSTFLSKLD